MQVAQLGNGLAIAIPQDVVDELGLKVGDDLEVRLLHDRSVQIGRPMTREEAIEDLRRFQGWMPADFKFDRDEANAR